jgi:hypothetical protein
VVWKRKRKKKKKEEEEEGKEGSDGNARDITWRKLINLHAVEMTSNDISVGDGMVLASVDRRLGPSSYRKLSYLIRRLNALLYLPYLGIHSFTSLLPSKLT